MTTIARLTDSCFVVTTEDGATLFDPGFHPWQSGRVDLDEIGDIQRVLVTHEHGDHVNPEFVRWLIDRGDDVVVHSNQAVADLLARHDIEVDTGVPAGVSAEDVTHGLTPLGTAPPNRSWTIDEIFTFGGDSFEPTRTAPVLALPLIVLWGSTTEAMDYAKRLRPQQVVPAHDFYLSGSGRAFLYGIAEQVLADAGIEFVALDWGESYTV
jgi:L-ascorbate metabolism protein UlaG (beta-lactamase superfamily)